MRLAQRRFGRVRPSVPALAGFILAIALSAPAGLAAAAGTVTQGGVIVPRVLVNSPILTGYNRPVFITNTGQSTTRIFIVEQIGRIQLAAYNAGTHSWHKVGVFLDIRSKVLSPVNGGGDEQGLLGLAFAPDYKTSGRFYVDYTQRPNGATVIAEYRRTSWNHASPATARTVLTISQPYSNHNGGMIAFKGNDLYIGMGDGGSGGDPQNRAQNLGVLLGKILRINPRDPDGSGPKHYSIPSDNPFVGHAGAKPQVWAYGVRNPWRWSFDSATGDMWIGDVGQDQFEEIDHAGTAKGLNFGWNKLEGDHVFNKANPLGSEPLCSTNCHTLPIEEYSHSFGEAVIGGYVYHGSAYPAWDNHYLYGDDLSGRIWEIPSTGSPGTPVEVTPPGGSLTISSFGVDGNGELYLADLGGSIYKLQLSGNP